jgi:hypothetical protein
MPTDQAVAAAILVAIAVLCGLVPPTVRRALVEGLRCMGRHSSLWRIPALFGVGYGAFQFLAEASLHLRMQDFGAWLFHIEWNPSPATVPLLAGSALPAAERTASIFTIFTGTFPLSAWFALLLIANKHGLLAVMVSALRRRVGDASGLVVSALLLLTALCAIAKPFIYLLHPEIVERVPFAAELAIDLLSTLFELVLGIFFLTCLMLTAYAWRRGLHFERARLFQVAMRRSGFVLKWSLLLAALALVLVQLPLQLATLLAPGSSIDMACEWFSEWIGRPAVVAIVLFHCPVQAILVFHNESLARALRDSRRILRGEWRRIGAFLAASFASFLLLSAASAVLVARLGFETSLALVARIPVAFFEGLLAGWLIASWVCLYKSLSASRKEIPF